MTSIELAKALSDLSIELQKLSVALLSEGITDIPAANVLPRVQASPVPQQTMPYAYPAPTPAPVPYYMAQTGAYPAPAQPQVPEQSYVPLNMEDPEEYKKKEKMVGAMFERAGVSLSPAKTEPTEDKKPQDPEKPNFTMKPESRSRENRIAEITKAFRYGIQRGISPDLLKIASECSVQPWNKAPDNELEAMIVKIQALFKQNDIAL